MHILIQINTTRRWCSKGSNRPCACKLNTLAAQPQTPWPCRILRDWPGITLNKAVYVLPALTVLGVSKAHGLHPSCSTSTRVSLQLVGKPYQQMSVARHNHSMRMLKFRAMFLRLLLWHRQSCQLSASMRLQRKGTMMRVISLGQKNVQCCEVDKRSTR